MAMKAQAAYGCCDTHEQGNIGEGAAGKKNQLGDDTRQNGRGNRARPDHDLRIFIEATRQQQTQRTPNFIRQEADQDEGYIGPQFERGHVVASRQR
jgi:hypothetical protein